MSLALVQATTTILLILVATWTCLLVTVSLMLPKLTDRAEEKLKNSSGACFGVGFGMFLVTIIGLVLLNAKVPPVQFVGMWFLLITGSLMTFGAAGLVQIIGKRGQGSGEELNFVSLLRSSLVFSLALGFPIIGWFVFLPLALIFTMGAGFMSLFALFQRRRIPPPMPVQWGSPQ